MNPPQPTKTFKVDHLPVKIYKDADSLGKAAALEAQRIIQEAIDELFLCHLCELLQCLSFIF